MKHLPRAGGLCALAGAALLLTGAPARAQGSEGSSAAVQAQLESLREQVARQQELLDAMRRQLGEQDARYQQLLQAVEEQKRATDSARAPAARTEPVASAPQPEGEGRVVQVGTAPQPEGEGRVVQVGTAPQDSTMAAVAQLFDQPSVLTPPGKLVLEPSLQYGYSSSNRVALVGFTVIPAILIGLIDVREVRRNTFTAALTGRYGLGRRSEIEVRVPYVHRSDSIVSREIFKPSAVDTVFQSSGSHIGDAEITGRYQLNDGSGGWPYLIGSLRFKSRTGLDPFEVTTNCTPRCTDPNVTGNGEPLVLPTSSGFYTLQPGITWLYPSDPAVFFGSFTYAYNFKRENVVRHVLGGTEELGQVKPGHAIGFNVGMGLALNDRSSFSIGIDVASIGRTRQNGVPVAGSVRTQLASLALGYSHVLDPKRTINLAVGAGLTRDTPDFTVTLRLPFTL